MKNTKGFKLFVLVTVLSLVFGSMVGTGAFAAESDAAITVNQTNLCYNEMMHLAINLEVTETLAEGDTLGILIWDDTVIRDGEAHDNNGDGIAEDGFIAAFEKYFNNRQNPQNGIWEGDVGYYSISGLMKISTSYNALGLKFNYAEKAFASALKAALIPADGTDYKGGRAASSTDVFNPWVAMSALLGNTKKFGTTEEYNRLQNMLRENLVKLIRVTTDKTKKFMKEDGSFGYTWGAPPYTSQGAPVCPPGIIEGDINGGVIATGGIFNSMCGTLGIKVPIFSGEDFEVFCERIKKNCGYK